MRLVNAECYLQDVVFKMLQTVEILVNTGADMLGEVQSCSVRFGLPKVIRTCR